jgi:protein-tyrosine kinase
MENTVNHPAPPGGAPSPLNSAHPDSSIGRLLLQSGKITPEKAESILRMQKELGIRFGDAARRLGFITEGDIEQVLAQQFDYPYLPRGAGGFSEKLLAAYQPFGRQVETLRAIRSQLILRWFARGRKSLVVVSIDPEDGASMFAANLAVVFSQLGEQTLLVDANLRTPAQHTIFNLPGRTGLSDILAGRAGMDAVSKLDFLVDLSILGAGTLPPNPQELLSRAAFSSLHGQLEARYDTVLYDVAAFSSGVDALALGARAGGVLLVARKDKTRVDDLATFSEQLERSGVEIVGAVLQEF